MRYNKPGRRTTTVSTKKINQRNVHFAEEVLVITKPTAQIDIEILFYEILVTSVYRLCCSLLF